MKPSMYAVKTEAKGNLFVMPKPSGEWLVDDIAYFSLNKITDIISLLQDDEIAELGLSKESEICNDVGIKFQRLPIQDRGLPEMESLTKLAGLLAVRIRKGANVAVHCRAGIGRAGLLACCILQEMNVGAVQALSDVSEARGVRVPDTPEQRDFIIDYKNSNQN